MALEIREEYYRKDHPDPETTTNKIIQLYIREGNYYKSRDKKDEAAAAYRTALEMMQVLEYPDLAAMAALLDIITVIDIQSEENEEAVFDYRKLMSIYAELHRERSMEYARTAGDLARVYVRMEQYENALPLYDSVVEIQSEILTGHDPELIRSLTEQAVAMTSLAKSYLESGRTSDAVPLFADAIEIRNRAGKTDDPAQAVRMNNLAGILISLERYEEAEKLYSDALMVLERSPGNEESQKALILKNMRHLYGLTGDLEKGAAVDSLLTGFPDGP
jgi:tetratricopeptide (TPR) repeat protein